MLESFKKHIASRLAFLNSSKLLIAISGGIDSVVLTHLCYKMGLNVALAHCNFNLRGEESDADEAFVLQFAEALDVEVFVENFDTKAYASDGKLSIQMAARELRYRWFEALATQLQFDYVLTAHHADDNLETFLINFTRGTGIEGLIGIPEVNDIFVRPLLPFSSQDILAYAKQNHLTWRDDSSNASTKYLRNKLRHEVIPVLKAINPTLLQNFQTTLNHLNDTIAIVDESMDAFLNKAIDNVSETSMTFKIAAFKEVENIKSYVYETFKIFGFTQWNDIENLLDAQSGKWVSSATHRLIKDRDFLLLSEIENAKPILQVILENASKIETPLGILNFEIVEGPQKSDSKTIFVDKDLLHFPLVIREKEEGDVFFPLGMQGKKKVSKYFKDEKFSLLDKEQARLLCSNNDIVWIIGKRADNRFKVTEKTKTILKITLE
ncbi:tRNA lysidine(34) synthetase TilS [Siansivirga zeaxanthinifaciens]|uniref:tRNA(Ile)-lysidine synthase n=1 Tax=Siansivirga zeaxanthinifaciens CC-SAMT-1 TaxID=1454006 RepID=A0A0C5WMF2_9FLAO|nr:tRNA lysidine(34) synthetase TilS [Siansivirga zeaxanthinifaciens]AJR04070.1 potassium ABC transporter ATPase [Siansivirga zeaxanthinifaciens CC-SAMT-1]